VVFATPSELAKMLQRDELDAALVSITEVLFNDRYDILDGTAIASLGEVKSVLLAHRKPIEEVREVYCDTASLTSVNLLRVLLAERGLKPEFKPLASYDFKSLPDFAMLIGDPALDFVFSQHEHEIFDLGAAWFEMTALPFVYAVWALRRGMENASLRRQLTEAREFGLDTIDHIIRNRTEFLGTAYYASMGFAVPASIGAQLANPKLRPLVLVGDGAFQMTGMELSTAARYKLNPIVVVLNNRGYGTERHMQDGAYNDVYPWQFSRLPQILDTGRGFIVRTENELDAALTAAQQHTQSFCLIEVMLEPLDRSPALDRLATRLAKRL